ncbi:hypothetical protein BDE02_14G157800 [Populus trichocarpa]|nr:hypothetical protein BDE02_14G157800 [Populus trichocarpa]
MPRPRQRRALLAIPELSGPPQPRRPGLQLASTGSGHRSRTRRISKGQGTGRGGKRRGQSCGGLSAPARKTEARPRQRAHHATSHVSQASDLRAGAAATAAVTSRQADGRAAAASTLARARQMNATPTPRISSPNAPDGLERVPKTVAGIGSSPAGKRVIDAGNTSGHEAPTLVRECGNPGSSPAAASDVGLAPAAPSLSHAGRRPERGGQGPKAAPRGRESKPAGAVACRGQRRRAGPAAPSLSHAGARARRQPPAGERASQQGLSPAAASDVGLAPAAPSLSHAGARAEGSPPAGERASQQGLSPAAASDVGLAPAAPSLSHAGGQGPKAAPRGRESKPAGAVACRGQRRRAGPCSA